jgi:hypothetical protein
MDPIVNGKLFVHYTAEIKRCGLRNDNRTQVRIRNNIVPFARGMTKM